MAAGRDIDRVLNVGFGVIITLLTWSLGQIYYGAKETFLALGARVATLEADVRKLDNRIVALEAGRLR